MKNTLILLCLLTMAMAGCDKQDAERAALVQEFVAAQKRATDSGKSAMDSAMHARAAKIAADRITDPETKEKALARAEDAQKRAEVQKIWAEAMHTDFEYVKEKAEKAGITETEIRTVASGPYPDNYKKLCEDAIRKQLKDPASAQFNFHETGPFMHQTKPEDGNIRYHWTVQVDVNAKNSLGGYTGFAPWFCDIYDGKVINAYH